jgi:hypothetical protein
MNAFNPGITKVRQQDREKVSNELPRKRWKIKMRKNVEEKNYKENHLGGYA